MPKQLFTALISVTYGEYWEQEVTRDDLSEWVGMAEDYGHDSLKSLLVYEPYDIGDYEYGVDESCAVSIPEI